MKKPEFESNDGESFFDALERHWEERAKWETTTILGGITKFWRWVRKTVINAWWFIRWETTDRYHMLDLRGPDYRRGYIDYNLRFLRAGFRCLEMMEEEDWGYLDVDETDILPETDEDPMAAQCNIGIQAQIEVYKEFKELLRWWRERPNRAADPSLSYYDQVVAWDAEDDAKLMRLVQLRGHMWA